MADEVKINEDIEKVNELTEKQKEIEEKVYRSMFVRRWKYIFANMYYRMKKHNLSVDDLKAEINNKTSPFTKSQREFIIGFETDFLEQCMNDLYKGPKRL